MLLVPGGTANLAVLGGNVPPSYGERAIHPMVLVPSGDLAGLVARPHRPVACATLNTVYIVPV